MYYCQQRAKLLVCFHKASYKNSEVIRAVGIYQKSQFINLLPQSLKCVNARTRADGVVTGEGPDVVGMLRGCYGYLSFKAQQIRSGECITVDLKSQ